MIVNYWVIVNGNLFFIFFVNGNLKRLLEIWKVWSAVILCVLVEALKIFVSGLVLHFGYQILCCLLLPRTVVGQSSLSMGFPRQTNTRMVATSRGSSQTRNQTQVSCTGRTSNTFTTASPGKQRDSVIHKHVSILPQTPLPSRLSYNTEQRSMCCSRSLLVIHFKYSSIYKLPNYPFPPSFPISAIYGNYKFIL